MENMTGIDIAFESYCMLVIAFVFYCIGWFVGRRAFKKDESEPHVCIPDIVLYRYYYPTDKSYWEEIKSKRYVNRIVKCECGKILSQDLVLKTF